MNNHVILNFRNCSNTLCMSKEPILEKKMSLEAKGLLALLCSVKTGVYEDDYDLNDILKKYCFESEDKIQKLLSELEEFGYIDGASFYNHRANYTLEIF